MRRHTVTVNSIDSEIDERAAKEKVQGRHRRRQATVALIPRSARFGLMGDSGWLALWSGAGVSPLGHSSGLPGRAGGRRCVRLQWNRCRFTDLAAAAHRPSGRGRAFGDGAVRDAQPKRQPATSTPVCMTPPSALLDWAGVSIASHLGPIKVALVALLSHPWVSFGGR